LHTTCGLVDVSGTATITAQISAPISTSS